MFKIYLFHLENANIKTAPLPWQNITRRGDSNHQSSPYIAMARLPHSKKQNSFPNGMRVFFLASHLKKKERKNAKKLWRSRMPRWSFSDAKRWQTLLGDSNIFSAWVGQTKTATWFTQTISFFQRPSNVRTTRNHAPYFCTKKKIYIYIFFCFSSVVKFQYFNELVWHIFPP